MKCWAELRQPSVTVLGCEKKQKFLDKLGGTVGNDAFFDGIIDEVYLWDRALSEDEVTELATGGRPSATAVEAAGKLSTLWGEVKAE